MIADSFFDVFRLPDRAHFKANTLFSAGRPYLPAVVNLKTPRIESVLYIQQSWTLQFLAQNSFAYFDPSSFRYCVIVNGDSEQDGARKNLVERQVARCSCIKDSNVFNQDLAVSKPFLVKRHFDDGPYGSLLSFHKDENFFVAITCTSRTAT